MATVAGNRVCVWEPPAEPVPPPAPPLRLRIRNGKCGTDVEVVAVDENGIIVLGGRLLVISAKGVYRNRYVASTVGLPLDTDLRVALDEPGD